MDYIAWIPTNAGYLNRQHVLTPKWEMNSSNKNLFYLKKQNLYVTDTNLNELILNQTIYQIECQIDFISDETWEFKIDIYDSDIHAVKSSGNIHKNGKTEFSCASVKQELLNGDLENIPNTVFTFLKQQIHRDLHHLEKVDNVIPVVSTSSDDWEKQTANRLVKKIKTLEFDAKRIYRDGLAWDKFKIIESIYWDAKGFKAYFDAFKRNILNNDCNNDYLDPEPIIKSLEAMQGKINASRQRRMTISTIIGTVIALFISLNIMTQNAIFHVPKGKEYMILLLVIFVIGLIFEIMMHLQFGSNLLIRFFDPDYKTKEYYQRLFLAGHTENKEYIEKFQNFEKRTKILFLFLKYGWIITAIFAFVFFILFIKQLVI